MGLLLSGGFAGIDAWIRGFEPNTPWHSLLFLGMLYLGSDLLSLPIQLYATFVVEARYGFNTTTPGTFLLDKLKTYALALLVGGPLVYGLLTIILHWGTGFWWRAWILAMAVSVGMGYLYTSLLLPIFNKLSPLPEGPLLHAIQQLTLRLHFPHGRVVCMDASKRSTKANAFFSGFGRQKTIVLTDNLLHDHTDAETVAVLAHEIGHYTLRHTWVQMGISAITTGAILFILSLVLFSLGMSKAMGASEWVVHVNLLAAGMLFSPINLVIGLFTNSLSRRQEYRADAFAAEQVPAQDLAAALGRLASNSLDDLFPHPAYVRAYYSHPTIPERLEALGALIAKD
jgi:STE24 endopeptidase